MCSSIRFCLSVYLDLSPRGMSTASSESVRFADAAKSGPTTPALSVLPSLFDPQVRHHHCRQLLGEAVGGAGVWELAALGEQHAAQREPDDEKRELDRLRRLGVANLLATRQEEPGDRAKRLGAHRLGAPPKLGVLVRLGVKEECAEEPA